ncbi:uncharacterized protein DS421_19g673260 [Arachis hypogaea]|uniref:Uncharacterized protein n=1 Tax=Arachis hypogaea TaxID=3818 RepID=A0A6B9VEF9_ARAHY|nr:uncharacterized protein DS421_19g673260 [Arachis hypogaea]
MIIKLSVVARYRCGQTRVRSIVPPNFPSALPLLQRDTNHLRAPFSELFASPVTFEMVRLHHPVLNSTLDAIIFYAQHSFLLILERLANLKFC